MNDPRGVLIVGNFLSAAGRSPGVCEELVRHLEERGWHVVTTSRHRGRARKLFDMVVTTITRREEYDVAQIDLFSGPSFLWADAVCRLLRLFRTPFILTLHGGGLPKFAERHPRKVRRLLSSAAAVTTPSGYLQETMSGYRSDLTLIPNGIDIALYRARRRERAEAKLIWVRSFHSIYRPELAVVVLAQIASAHGDATLTMVGPDKGDGSLARVIREAERLGVRDRLRLTGFVEKTELPALLDAADIFLNTATIDNAPVSVLEAMASGLCIVSTNVGGIPHVIDSGETGVLVPPGDLPSMTAATEKLLASKDFASRCSGNAIIRAQRCDWRTVIHQWEILLDGLMKGPGGLSHGEPA